MTDPVRLAIVAGVFALTLAGWAIGGTAGAAIGLTAALLTLVAGWRGQPLWRWAFHLLNRNRPIVLAELATVANDRCAGGVRYQDGVAVVALQLLGRAHVPTLLTGSAGVVTADTVDVGSVLPMLRQSLGLRIESAAFITVGARRRSTGDYPRIYDTLIGTVPYAGRRETWLVLRIRDLENGDALRWRRTIGTAALGAAQRFAAALREQGVRARVANATDIVELERRVAWSALEPQHRRWHTLRGRGGWLTTYMYRPADVSASVLASAWMLNADGIVQNLTVFPDGTCSATVTVRTAQPPTASPSVVLRTLPGRQARALANNLCGPRDDVPGQHRGALPDGLTLPVGPSGVLLGKSAAGDRLLLPLTDPAEPSRIRICADDAIAKRIVIRAAAAGEQVTVHSRDSDRWDGVRMPDMVVTDRARPAPGTTVSVIDGTVTPAPKPATVIEIAAAGSPGPTDWDVLIAQTGPGTVEVRRSGVSDEVAPREIEIEFFRAENRYADGERAVRRLLDELALEELT